VRGSHQGCGSIARVLVGNSLQGAATYRTNDQPPGAGVGVGAGTGAGVVAGAGAGAGTLH
jgi:hypothetical protein